MTEPFFIVGAPRSGTTLLRVMLDRHSELAIPPESHFIPHLWVRRRTYGHGDAVRDVSRFLADLGAIRRFVDWDLPLETLRPDLERYPHTFAQTIDVIFAAYAAREGKVRWADKTPSYIKHVDLISELFPEARFVHLIRDGRDVALSVLDVGSRHNDVATVAASWRRTMRKGRAARARLGQERWMDLKYEDLVRDVEASLRGVCSFLDLPYESTMSRADGDALRKVPAARHRWHTRLAMPVTGGLRDWRTQMPARSVLEFEAIARRELTNADYPTSGRPITVRTALNAWGGITKFALRRRLRLTQNTTRAAAADMVP